MQMGSPEGPPSPSLTLVLDGAQLTAQTVGEGGASPLAAPGGRPC